MKHPPPFICINSFTVIPSCVMRKQLFVATFDPVEKNPTQQNKNTTSQSWARSQRSFSLIQETPAFFHTYYEEKHKEPFQFIHTITNRQMGGCSHQKACRIIAKWYLIFLLARQHMKNRYCSTNERKGVHLKPGLQ